MTRVRTAEYRRRKNEALKERRRAATARGRCSQCAFRIVALDWYDEPMRTCAVCQERDRLRHRNRTNQ